MRFILLAILIFGIGHVQASNSSCTAPADIEIGFFNGVLTELTDAADVIDYLEFEYGNTAPNGAAISYTQFYNRTQGLKDFVETFSQRLKEQDAILQDKYYLFFEAVQGGGGFTEVIRRSVPALSRFFAALAEDAMAKKISDLLATSILNLPPNKESADFSKHAAMIDETIRKNHRFLIIAHSQGNLFANRAYEYYTSKAPKATIDVIHVAPASPILNGRHVLADKDFVIQGLRPFGAVAATTTEIPLYGFRGVYLGIDDPLGHGLFEVYLNQNIDTWPAVDSLVKSSISTLSSKDAYDTSVGPCIKITRVTCDDGSSGERRWTLEGKAKAPPELGGVAVLPVYAYDDGFPYYDGYYPLLDLKGATSKCVAGGWDATLNGVYGINACARWTGGPIETKWTSSAVSVLRTGLDAASARKMMNVRLYQFPALYYDDWFVRNGIFPKYLGLAAASVKSCPGVYNVE